MGLAFTRPLFKLPRCQKGCCIKMSVTVSNMKPFHVRMLCFFILDALVIRPVQFLLNLEFFWFIICFACKMVFCSAIKPVEIAAEVLFFTQRYTASIYLGIRSSLRFIWPPQKAFLVIVIKYCNNTQYAKGRWCLCSFGDGMF